MLLLLLLHLFFYRRWNLDALLLTVVSRRNLLLTFYAYCSLRFLTRLFKDYCLLILKWNLRNCVWKCGLDAERLSGFQDGHCPVYIIIDVYSNKCISFVYT
jgi:hypothetical protein